MSSNENITVWILVILILIFSLLIIYKFFRFYSPLRLGGLLACLCTLSLTTTMLLWNYSIIPWIVHSISFTTFSTLYIDFCVVVLLHTGEKFYVGTNARTTGWWTIVTVLVIANIIQIANVVLLILYGDGTRTEDTIFLILAYTSLLLSILGSVLYTFLPLALSLRPRIQGSYSDVFAVGIWYFTICSNHCLAHVTYYIIVVVLTGNSRPSHFAATIQAGDYLFRTTLVLVFCTPCPHRVSMLIRKKFLCASSLDTGSIPSIRIESIMAPSTDRVEERKEITVPEGVIVR